MAQNIYDCPEFFQAYARLPRSVHGLACAPEWSSLHALIPALQERSVVDLGCGFGWFCRWARSQGTRSVLGLDVSESMLAKARALTLDAGIEYGRADLEVLELPEHSFDFAYSSLVFHYVENLRGLLDTVHQALVRGGQLVFSMEHPIVTASRRPRWVEDDDGTKGWVVDSYQSEGPRTTDWLAKGVMKQHRTLGTVLNMLLAAGFVITHVEEWAPTEAQVMTQPSLAEDRERPMFVLVRAHR